MTVNSQNSTNTQNKNLYLENHNSFMVCKHPFELGFWHSEQVSEFT